MRARLFAVTALTLSLSGAALAQNAAPAGARPPANATDPAGAPNEGRQQQGPSLKIERDIEYGRAGTTSLKLDLYRMDPSSAPQPVIVWIHGEGDLDTKAATPAGGMIRAGAPAVASIEYRRGAGVTLAQQLSDVKTAIRWIRANARAHGLDGEKIGVFGYGRGGQLAALAGTTTGVPGIDDGQGSSRVQAVVDVAGPVTTGGLNPASYVTADDAPTLIIHGTADSQVSTQESQKLVSALKVGKVASQMDMPFAVGHDLGELLSPTVMQSITSFFGQYLMGQRVQGGLSAFVSSPPASYIDPVALDLGGTQYKLYPTTNARGAGTQGSYRIYLPPGYATSGARRYPVIYFFHGRSVDSKRPITANYIARADAAIRQGVMPPTIIVLVQGDNQGWYMDSQDGKRPMESIVAKDLIPYIDRTYRTVATREGRAIEGHSMGGFGALRFGFKYSDRFAGVTGNSPANILEVTDDMGDQAFWERNSISSMIKANTARLKTQKIRIIIGTEDSLITGARLIDTQLTQLGVPHTFQPVTGSPHNHDQLVQYETFDTMAFYGDLFGRYRLPTDPKRR